MKPRMWIYLALVATTMVWGGSFVAIKQALHYVTPAQLVVLRFVPASGVFAALLWHRERRTLPAMLRSSWPSLALMGLLGVVVYHMALNTGEQLIPAGTASLIIALNPAFVFFLSALFLHERITPTQWAGLCLAFAGLFIIVRFASGNNVDFRYLLGVLITIAAPLAWAAYTVLSRPLSQRFSPLAVTGIATIAGTLPVLVTIRPALLPIVLSMPPDGWASVLYLSLACTVVGFTVWNVALRHLEASHAGGFVYLSPLWGVVFSRFLLHEPASWALVAGAVVVFGGVILVSRTPTGERAYELPRASVPLSDGVLAMVSVPAYALQRGKIGPLRLFIVAILATVLSVIYAVVRFAQGTAALLPVLVAACGIASTALLLWARARRFVAFHPLVPRLEPAPDLQPEEKLMLRGSGFFEVNGMRRYLVEAPAVFWTTRMPEHIVCAKVSAPNFLGVGVPASERGWWYAFLVPRHVTDIIPGRLYFGLQRRLAVRVVYSTGKEKDSIYLSCAEEAQMAILLKELRARTGLY